VRWRVRRGAYTLTAGTTPRPAGGGREATCRRSSHAGRLEVVENLSPTLLVALLDGGMLLVPSPAAWPRPRWLIIATCCCSWLPTPTCKNTVGSRLRDALGMDRGCPSRTVVARTQRGPSYKRRGPEPAPGATRSGIALGPSPAGPSRPRPPPSKRAGAPLVPAVWNGQTPRRAHT
jgi:hypothetical protein